MSNPVGSLLAGWRLRALIVSVVIAASGYLAFAIWSGWADVVNAVVRVGLPGILFALSMSLVNYGLRFLRWQTYLRALGAPLAWHPSLAIYLAGFALTTTPGKAGETLRSVLLKQHQISYSSSFAAFFSERLSDLLAVVLLTLLGLGSYPTLRPLIVIGILLVLTGLLVLTQPSLINLLASRVGIGASRLQRVLRHGFDVLIAAQHCHTPPVLAKATLLSLIGWFAEGLAFFALLHWMGFETSIAFAVFVYAVAMLAGALSFMPGGLGGTEAVMVTLLLWGGMAGADAIAATVLIRLATLWFAVAIGVGFLYRCNGVKTA